ncbi:MAG: NifB/NifX family molybdenum-iron cluster-binding protein [Bacteroidales bacterium]|nr:NifB/NifX family molybdenum-iron cluster-binding protein [Bacteroidales bacterium]
MMIAIPASAKNPDALIDERFARCPFFCFYNTKTMDFDFKENTKKDAMEGVGPQVAEFLANNGIMAVYTCEVGPKAKMILEKLNITINIVKSNQTVKQITTLLNN